MDFNVAVALYETADDLAVLHDFPQSLLIKLYLHIDESLNTRSLKRLSKSALIKKLGDVVRCHHSSPLNSYNADTRTKREKEGIADAEGNLKHPDPIRLMHAKQAISQRKKTRILGRETLREVWSDMKKTTLPSWCCPAPTQIGDGEHGKISADGWRTFCTVHLIVTLGRLWGHSPPESRRYKLLVNFYSLVHATKIATNRSITSARAQEFQDYMITYLRGLNELFPTYQLVPTHHVVLHMRELLCRFGPTHAWRCWVFERYNHTLQKIPTNGKFGTHHVSLTWPVFIFFQASLKQPYSSVSV